MPLINLKEAADLLGVHRNTVTNSIKRGDLPQPLLIGRRWKFDRDELLKTIKGQATSTHA